MTAAIISVFNKEGIGELASGLVELGIKIYSTGGTQKILAEDSVPVSSISALTGFPEILDGRVKTLHPKVYGGVLAKRALADHMNQLAENEIPTIDLVCVNLYPFAETISSLDVSLAEALDNIDIGGPSMIRAAAKNFPDVLVLVDPGDYKPVLEQLQKESGGATSIPLEFRQLLAEKAFQHVASYDTIIAQYLRNEGVLPEQATISLKKEAGLRYGENPHQRAALYREDRAGAATAAGIVAAKQIQGKELSYNNILDADAAWAIVADFAEPTVVIVKHNNPCGLASHDDLNKAYREALAGDPVSAFGGIVAVNRPLSGVVAAEIADTFYEIIMAPTFSAEALSILGKKTDLRLLELGNAPVSNLQFAYRQVSGGLLLQEIDKCLDDEVKLQLVSKRAPTAIEEANLSFACKIAKHIKSNAIVIARDHAMLGMGSGQPNRVVSVHLALRLAGQRPDNRGAEGSVLASDAFFPFPDGVEMAASGGVTAIIQPGGSIRDDQAIRVADEQGMAMLFTNRRHFKH